MTITTSSVVTAVPKQFCGLRVLLIESDSSSLQHHASILLQNSYRVTATPDVATGLSKILNEESYDCVLIDADIIEKDLVNFLHQTYKHQPQLFIILMVSNDIGMRLFKETLENEAVLCLPKPCGPRDICNIWQHVCRKRKTFEGGDYSNGISLKENQEPNMFNRVDPMVKQSIALNPTLIDNTLSSSSGTQEGLKINSHEYAAIFKPVMYEDLRSNDHDQEHVHETNLKENISRGTMKNVHEGKQSREHKRANDQLDEHDRYCRKRKYTKTRITWTRNLHRNFLEAVSSLEKQKAYPTAILETMKVPSLTRSQVASHLQKYQEHKKAIKNRTLIPLMQKGNNLQVERYAYGRRGQSTPSDDSSSILSSNIIQRPLTLNSIGISYMTINNIKARLEGAPLLPVIQPATTINKSDSDHTTYHSFCHIFQSSMGETQKITTFGSVENSNSSTSETNEVQSIGKDYGSVTRHLENIESMTIAPMDNDEVVAPVDAASSTNGFVSGNCLTSASLKPLGYLGLATDPWVSRIAPSDYGLGFALEPLEGFAVGVENYNPEMYEISNMFAMTTSTGGGTSASLNHNVPELLALPKSGCRNFDILHSLDIQGSGENMFPTFPHTTTLDGVDHSINTGFSISGSVPLGIDGIGYSFPRFPGEENNWKSQTLQPFSTIVSVGGSVRTVMESDFFSNRSQCHIEMTMNILNELDADLINGPW